MGYERSGHAPDAHKLSADDIEFMMAVDTYKRTRRRPFPTSHEVLAVAVSLGYRKVAPAGPLPAREDVV